MPKKKHPKTGPKPTNAADHKPETSTSTNKASLSLTQSKHKKKIDQKSNEFEGDRSVPNSPPPQLLPGDGDRTDKGQERARNLSQTFMPTSSSHATFQSFDLDKDVTDGPAQGNEDNDVVESDRMPYETIKRELENTKAHLADMEQKYNKLKSVCRKEQVEASAIREDIASEVTARHSAESMVERLQESLSFYERCPTAVLHSEEHQLRLMDEVRALIENKVDLEQQCDILQSRRDGLVDEINKATYQFQDFIEKYGNIPTEHWETLKETYDLQLRSLNDAIRVARDDLSRLGDARKDIMDEMVLLNTKNAELSNMNNELSRRITERERETMALLAGTNFIPSRSSSLSSETTSIRPSGDSHPNAPRGFNEEGGAKDDGSGGLFNSFMKSRSLIGKMARTSLGRKEDEEEATGTGAGAPPANVVYAHEGHQFLTTTFIRPVRCEACGEKIWGASELKCQGCGVASHGQCFTQVHKSCMEQETNSTALDQATKTPTRQSFGADLVSQVQSERGQVPALVQKCVEAIEKRAFRFEGIYRKSGGVTQMRIIQQAFDDGKVDLNLCDEEKWSDISAVSSVLKQYFRELANPLFTYEFHSNIISIAKCSDGEQKLTRMYEVLHSLPDEHYCTIQYLMKHLHRVAEQSHENLMTSRNLAVVFGPTLLRNADDAKDIEETAYKIQTIEYILQHTDALFADTPPSGMDEH